VKIFTDTHEAMIVCPGCGVRLPDGNLDPPGRVNASGECLHAYSDLQCCTVGKQDPWFIHQHVVDTYAAQHSGGPTRAITVAFGLIGLYLALEKGFTGKQVQLAHMRIARTRKVWPHLDPPSQPAVLTVMDVLQAGTDEEKDALIREWMAAVWESWADRQRWVRAITDELLISTRKYYS
jgi:hypothetical protein